MTQQTPFPVGKKATDCGSNISYAVIMKSSEHTRMRALSMKWLNSPNAIMNILTYIEYEFPEERRPYIFLDIHSNRRKSLLNVRTLMIPRAIGEDKETKVFAPVIFVPQDRINELPFLKRKDLVA